MTVPEVLKEQLNEIKQSLPKKLKLIKKAMRTEMLLGLGAVVLAIVIIFAATAAWYTNTAKTGTLSFETEAWGYNEKNVTVSKISGIASPGKSGVVPLTVNNGDSAETVRIGVSVLKKQMDTELQRRIYFYADVSAENNGERVSKVYLGAGGIENYTYTVLGGNILTMSDMYYNDVPIKWEWVYDTVGYYFKGTVDSNVYEEEYVRPIEYDFEKAVFETDADSSNRKLVSVNGMTTAEFLKNFSRTDGYEGIITEKKVVGDKDYYKVAVDENGYGIWAYLCNYSEILRNIETDTKYAEQPPIDITARVKITAQNIPSTTKDVYDYNDFYDALYDTNEEVIVLKSDIKLPESVNFLDESYSPVIDLNGHTLYCGVTDNTLQYLMGAFYGGSATIINGEISNGANYIENAAAPVRALYSAGGSLTLSNVKINGFAHPLQIADSSTGGRDSVVKVYNSDLNGDNVGIYVTGNGEQSEGKTQLIVQNSTIYGKSIGIGGNGTATAAKPWWGTSIVVLDSNISGGDAGIYHPQKQSDMLISASKISGNNGIVVKSGDITVYNSEIEGIGAYKPPKSDSSGFTDTGDAVYIEGNYKYNASVAFYGNNKVTSKSSYAVDLFGVADKGYCKVIVYDGDFDGMLGSFVWNGIGSFDIYNDSLRDKLILTEP